MQVFIMRHGEAVIEAASDTLRSLSECGCDESVQMAAWLNEQHVNIERVLVSPYLRALQTLEQVRQVLALPAGEEVLSELMPGGSASVIAGQLHQLALKGVASVMVISHLPLVGYLVAELCPQEGAPMFATSAIACIELDADSGTGDLQWHISPSQLLQQRGLPKVRACR